VALSEKIIPKAIAALEDVKPSIDKVSLELERLAKDGGEQTDELERLNKEMLKAIEERMVKMLADVAADAVQAAKAKINLEPLLTFLDPFDRLGDFVKPFLALFPDIHPHISVLRSMLEYRAKIEKQGIGEGTAPIEDLLDREEARVLWSRWWTHWEYRWAVWSLYYQSWGITELSSTAWAFREHGLKYAKLHKKLMKKFSFGFGDHLHEKAKTATSADFNAAVSGSFVQGYHQAVAWFRPRATAILAELVQDFVYRIVGSKVESFALKALDPVITPLASTVPSPINEVVEVEQIATDAVRDALHQIFRKIVAESIVEPAAKAWGQSAFGK